MKRNYSNALKKYSALTGSALIAGTKIAQAQVIYTDENPDLVASAGTVEIDINNDGQMDIGFVQSGTFYNYARLSAPGGSATQVLTSGFPQALTASTAISSSSTTWSNVGSNTLEAEYSGSGNFGGAGDRYVGVRFQILGQYHYGWVLINVPPNAATITIKSYAYEATANAAIITGNSTPTVDIQGEPNVVNSVASFPVTFQFSEDVTGFDVTDIVVGNGTVGNFQTTDANTYTADITPDGNGDVTIDVNASAATGTAFGSSSVAAIQATTIYDATAPTVTIQSAPSIVNSNASFNVTFQFSEDVTGFDVSDIVVVNGAVGNFQTTNASTYTADITPDGNGDVTIDVAGSVAQDGATNNNTAATQVVVTYDATAPTVAIQSAPSIVNSSASFNVTFQFSEDVTGFDVSDIVVGNGAVGNFQTTNASTYTADITPDGNGDITIDVAGSVAQDGATNNNTAATQVVVTYDATAPTVAIQSAPSIVNSNASFNVTFQFSEDVTGFDVSDIVVGNGAVGNFQTTNGSTYTADITPDSNGDITIDVAGSVAQDGATNNNTAASQVVVTYDAIAPTVAIQSAPSIVNSSASFNVTFQFSEDVTGFDVSDIVVGNGSAGNFQTTNGSTYTADITPDGNGDITIDVASSVAQDGATNNNTAATQVLVTYDATAPTVTIQSAPASVNNTSPFSVTFQFSEDVTGFDVSDIVVGNGSAGNFQTTNGSTYTADITPDGNGDITIDVSGSVAQDGATNNNTAATQVVVTYNATTGVDGGIAASVNVFPNPVANVVTIEGVDVVSVSVLDNNGSQVASSSSNSVDLSGIASGTYILSIETNDGTILKRVIKE